MKPFNVPILKTLGGVSTWKWKTSAQLDIEKYENVHLSTFNPLPTNGMKKVPRKKNDISRRSDSKRLGRC